MTKRWFDAAPWPELFAAGWENMSEKNREKFMALSWYNHCKAEYERALEWSEVEGDAWEDLTDEQRENVGKRIQENAQKMQALGKKIASGNALDVALSSK
jgi:predicted Fe-S protein YdhL (DUF1289 family)